EPLAIHLINGNTQLIKITMFPPPGEFMLDGIPLKIYADGFNTETASFALYGAQGPLDGPKNLVATDNEGEFSLTFWEPNLSFEGPKSFHLEGIVTGIQPGAFISFEVGDFWVMDGDGDHYPVSTSLGYDGPQTVTLVN
ncbi:hypothetical protein JKY72_02640, partial [Candidatus Gracilibacteria bacterium]|nr:hypothetical protein [Candidatus Gracilibacteria bacterium]